MQTLEKSHTLEQIKKWEDELLQNGYFVIDLCNPQDVEQAAEQLEQHLKKITRIPEITLLNYHHYFDDEMHYQVQFQMLEFFREQQFAQNILKNNIDVYQYILGPDLDIQREPYFRITRPNKPKDNIGFHRDTFYGTGPGEISTIIPFVDLDEKQTLLVYPKSHIMSDEHFKFVQTINEDVPKNSPKHKMGFLYAPKLLSDKINSKMVPIPLKRGQALVFMLSIIHGSEENKSQTPRWSTDIRIKNSLVPLNQNMKTDYYIHMKTSVTLETFKLMQM